MNIKKTIRVGITAALLASAPVSSLWAADQTDAARIRELVDTGMHYYWSGGDIKKAEAEVFKGITLHGRYDVVEQAFTQASALSPERLDFRYAIASARILQKNTDGAIETLTGITRVDPNAFNAYTWLAALAHIRNDAAAYRNYMDAMAGIDHVRADQFRQRFARADAIMAESPNQTVPVLQNHSMVVILGYALAEDGSMRQPLLQRLEVGLEAAKKNPDAYVMVTGGQPQSGVTEGDMMMRWLVDHGISRDRIIIEDKSKDTVGNMLNVANLLHRHTADDVILVTSASHMRRARSVLEDALGQYDDDAVVHPLIALDFDSIEEAAKVSDAERLVVYRDLLRVAGLWAFPGLQQ